MYILYSNPGGRTDKVRQKIKPHLRYDCEAEGAADFISISAGPLLQFNPSVSFIVKFDPVQDAGAKEELNALWEKLSVGGSPLISHLMFVGDQCGKAEQCRCKSGRR